MKHKQFSFTHNAWRVFFSSLAIASMSFLGGCKDDDPEKEDTPELITKATLTFTPAGGGTTVTVTATDPDGEGVQDLTVDGPINLVVNKTYTLNLELINGLAQPTEPEYDVTAEVEGESDEHMFFFGWTNNVFSDPSGNGNIDNRADDVNYNDVDEEGLPLGLSTTWATVGSAASGTFRIILKHQPDLKSATTTSDIGESDIDLTFTISVN
jgi:hypothetical protein